MFITREEEQCAQTDLLDVHPNEHVLKGSGEEEPSSVICLRLFYLVKEAIFVHLIEEEERSEGESVDDRRNDHICDTYRIFENRIKNGVEEGKGQK